MGCLSGPRAAGAAQPAGGRWHRPPQRWAALAGAAAAVAAALAPSPTAAATVAAALVPSPAVATSLPPDRNLTLRDSIEFADEDKDSLTLDPVSSPITLRQTSGSTLNLTMGTLTKTGTAGATLTGGRVTVLGRDINSLTTSVTGGDLIIGSALVGSYSLTKTGTGTLALTNTSTEHNFTGNVFVNAGTLRIASDLNLGAGSTNTNDVHFNGGTLETTASINFRPARRLFINTNGGALRVNAGTLTIDNDGQLATSRGFAEGPLFKDGTGLLRISSANSYSGNLRVRAGILELRNVDALGAAGSPKSEITLDDRTRLNLLGDDELFLPSFDNDLVVNGAAIVSVAPLTLKSPTRGAHHQLANLKLRDNARLQVTGIDRSLHFSGTTTVGDLGGTRASGSVIDNAVGVRMPGRVTGFGAFTKDGAGTMTLSGAVANDYTGPTRVLGGRVELGKSTGVNAVPHDLEVLGGTVALLNSNQIADVALVTLGGGGLLDLNARSDAVAELTNASGSLRLSGGTLRVAPPAAGARAAGAGVSLLSGGETVVDGGGTLDTLALVIAGGDNRIDAFGTIVVGLGGLAFTGGASPALRMSSNGVDPGTLVLNADTTFDGPLGTAEIRSEGPVPFAGTVDLNGGGRTFTVTNVNAALDVSARVVNGSLTKAGPGVLRLRGPSTYAGGTTISTGALEAADPAALGTGAVRFSGGTLRLRSDAADTTFGSPANPSAAIAATADSEVKVDIDRLTLPGTAGTFRLGNLSLGARLNVTGANGGTLVFTRPVTLLKDAAVIDVAAGVGVTLDGAVEDGAGTFSLTKVGAGTLTLGGGGLLSKYNGTTTVNDGVLALGKSAGVIAIPAALNINGPGTVRLTANDQIEDTATVTFNISGGTATLDLNGRNETVRNLASPVTGGGSVVLGNATVGGGTLTVSPTAPSTFSGVISGSGRVVKNGTSALTLSGANTFDGGATVNGGTLTFSLQAPRHVGPTLTGGTWQVTGSSSLVFGAGSDILITGPNAAVTLSGGGASFAKINNLASNQGQFTVTGGRAFATAGALANGGTLTVGGGGSVLTVTAGGLAGGGSGGTTDVQAGGTLTANFVRQGNLIVGGAVNVRPQGAGGDTSAVDALVLSGATGNWTGRLDLADTSLIVRDGSLATVTDQVKTGANLAAGFWDGPGGIVSSAAAFDASRRSALGVLLNDNGAGQPIYTSFGGQAAALGDVLVMRTVFGDADLSGGIDGRDYALLDVGFAFGRTGWASGDFNFSGAIDPADYALIDAGLEAQGTAPALAAERVALHARQFGAPYLDTLSALRDGTYFQAPAAVPEPAGAALLAAAIGVLSQRHRRTARAAGRSSQDPA